MNLILRAFIVSLLSKMGSKKAITDASELTFHVMPHDLSFRDHLPNFRYLSFFEIGRQHVLEQARVNRKTGYDGRLIAAQDVTYLQEVRPFQRFKCKTEIIGWDHKYCYFLHRVYSDKSLSTVALAKETFVANGKVIAPSQIFNLESPALDEALSKWRELQQAVRPLSER